MYSYCKFRELRIPHLTRPGMNYWYHSALYFWIKPRKRKYQLVMFYYLPHVGQLLVLYNRIYNNHISIFWVFYFGWEIILTDYPRIKLWAWSWIKITLLLMACRQKRIWWRISFLTLLGVLIDISRLKHGFLLKYFDCFELWLGISTS